MTLPDRMITTTLISTALTLHNAYPILTNQLLYYYGLNIEGRGEIMQSNSAKYAPDLLRGNTDFLLLFLIREGQHMYGYQLIKEIEKRSRGYFQFKEGTVYPTLHKLENEGLVQGEWQELSNGQQRRYYCITERGKEVLREKIAAWQGFTTAVSLVFNPATA